MQYDNIDSPVTCESSKFARLEKKLLKAPKKAANFFDSCQDGNNSPTIGGFRADRSDSSYYCDTTGYQNYLKQIRDVRISSGPFSRQRMGQDSSNNIDNLFIQR